MGETEKLALEHIRCSAADPYVRPIELWLQATGHKVKCPVQDFSTHMSVLMRNKLAEDKLRQHCKQEDIFAPFCCWNLPV